MFEGAQRKGANIRKLLKDRQILSKLASKMTGQSYIVTRYSRGLFILPTIDYHNFFALTSPGSIPVAPCRRGKNMCIFGKSFQSFKRTSSIVAVVTHDVRWCSFFDFLVFLLSNLLLSLNQSRFLWFFLKQSSWFLDQIRLGEDELGSLFGSFQHVRYPSHPTWG